MIIHTIRVYSDREDLLHVFFYYLQTYIGSVVVSVNPYKQLGIYGTELMEEYKGVNFYELPPHM